MDPIDLGPVVNALPLSPQAKLTILFLMPFAYFALMLARRVAPPDSTVGKTIRLLLSGWKHPDEKPIPDVAEKKTPAAPSATAIALLVAASLLFAAPARAQEPAPSLPATLCAIGAQGNWCFGFLPTVSVVGIDVKHGNVIGGVQIGTSIAATWRPGALDSVTLGAHTGFQAGTANTPQTASLGATFSTLKGYLTIITDWQVIGGDHAFIIAPAFGAAY